MHRGLSHSAAGPRLVLALCMLVVCAWPAHGLFSRTGDIGYYREVNITLAAFEQAALGSSTALQGDIMVAGAPNDNTYPQGRVAVFYRSQQDNTTFDFRMLLNTSVDHADALTQLSYTGSSVDMTPDAQFIAVGGYNYRWSASQSTYTGRVLLYARNQGGADQWGRVKDLAPNATLVPFTTTIQFGRVVSFSSDGMWLAVSTYAQTSVYIYGRNHGGTDNWGFHTFVQPVPREDYNAQVGYSSLEFDTNDATVYLVVPAQNLNPDYPETSTSKFGFGTVFLYARNQGGPNNFGLVKRIGPTSSTPYSGDRFGTAVSISSETGVLVVGSPGARTQISPSSYYGNVGRAHVFHRNKGGVDNWGQVAELTSTSPTSSDDFGAAVYAFPYSDGVWVWKGRRGMWVAYDSEFQVTTSSVEITHSGNDEYGLNARTHSIDWRRNQVVMGSVGDDNFEANAGGLVNLAYECPPGRQLKNFPQACEGCPRGKYSNHSSMAPCRKCAPGRSVLTTGATECNVVFPQLDSLQPIARQFNNPTDLVVTGASLTSNANTLVYTQQNGSNSFSVTCNGAGSSSTQLRCSTPNFPSPGVYTVAGDTNSYPLYTAPVFYALNPTISGFLPRVGSDLGGTYVNITGTGFLPTGQVRCTFGNHYSVAAVDQTLTSFACLAPEARTINGTLESPVSLNVTFNNGLDSQNIGSYYFFTVRPSYGVRPVSGPLTGGTVVEVPIPHVQAAAVPPAVYADTVRIKITDGQGTNLLAPCVTKPSNVSVLQCILPDFRPTLNLGGFTETVEIRLSLSGNNQYSLPSTFSVYADPLVTRIEPATVLSTIERNLPISILGSPFVSTGTILVNMTLLSTGQTRLGYAEYRSSGLLTLNMTSFNTSGTAEVSISQNAQQYSPSKGIMSFVSVCPAGQSSPNDNSPCEPCAAGTVKPLPGTDSCTVCAENTYCPLGSVQQIDCPDNTFSGPGSGSVDNCACQAGFYHPQGLAGQACLACPEGAVCNGLATKPLAQPGFWNSGNPGDFTFLRCSVPQACRGGASVCSLGYTGRLCSTCEAGFYQLSSLCERCPSNPSIALTLTIIGFLIFLFVVRKIGVRRSAGTLAMGLSLLQMTALFADFRMNWPDIVLQMFSLLTITNLNIDVSAPECNINGLTYNDKFKFVLLIPFIVLGVMLVLLILELLRGLLVNRWGERVRSRAPGFCAVPPKGYEHTVMGFVRHTLHQMRYSVSTWFTESQPAIDVVRSTCNAFCLMLILMYIILTSKTTEAFACSEISPGRSALTANPKILCWESPEHEELVLYGLVSLFVYVLGIPAGVLLLLWLNRDNLDSEESYETFGSLYERYKPRYYYFECINLMRKAFMIMLKVFTTLGLIQGMFGQLLLVLTCLLQIRTTPYRFRYHNVMALSLLMANFATLVVGLGFLGIGVTKFTREVLSYVTIGLLALMLLLILVFVVLEKRNLRTVGRFRREQKMERKRSQAPKSQAGGEQYDNVVVDPQNYRIEEIAWTLLRPEFMKMFVDLIATQFTRKDEYEQALKTYQKFAQGQQLDFRAHFIKDNITELFVDKQHTTLITFFNHPEVDEHAKQVMTELIQLMRQAQLDRHVSMMPSMCLSKKDKQEMETLTKMAKFNAAADAANQEGAPSDRRINNEKNTHSRTEVDVERPQQTQNQSQARGTHSREQPPAVHVEEVAMQELNGTTTASMAAAEEENAYAVPQVDTEEEEEVVETSTIPPRSKSRVKSTFIGAGQNQLTVNEGSTVNVLQRQDGWAWCEVDGQMGYVPEALLDE